MITYICFLCNGVGRVVESSPYILGTPAAYNNTVAQCGVCNGTGRVKVVTRGETRKAVASE